MQRGPAPARPLAAIGGVLGPATFVTAWSVLGARTARYSAVHDAISRLAATGAPTQAAMTAGFVAFGAGMQLFAVALRSRWHGPAWALASATGLATLGVAAAPLGSPTRDSVHGAFAALGYATLAALPPAASRSLAADDRPGWARASVAVGAASAACLVASIVGPRHGMFQRAGLGVVDVWVVAMSVDMLVSRPRHR